ncbi:MAG: sulfatase [Verrucomicrobiota bacterium]
MKSPFPLLVLLWLTATLALAKDAPPNVVWIISDDQTWTDYSFMGHEQIDTPHIDKLAKQSLTYTRGYVPVSLCSPSLISMITGLYPHQHGITGNEPRMPETGNGRTRYTKNERFRKEVRLWHNQMAESLPSVPRMLHNHLDYFSHQSGKWWMGNYANGGFTHGMTHGDIDRGGRHGDQGLKIGREGMAPVTEFIDMCVDGKNPFFVWYAPFLPHTPHNPPQRLLEKYKKRTDSVHVAKYWAMVEWFDETCGELLEHLDKKGVADNTLVIYMTDNGWIQQRESQKYAERSKRSPYDGGLRTPLMIRWPGKVEPASIDTPVSTIDVAPTTLKACGVDYASMWDLPGIDLLDPEAVKAREFVFGDMFLHNAEDIHDPKTSLTYRWGLRNKDGWKLILPHTENVTKKAGFGSAGQGEIELFNVFDDPLEENNLASDKPDIVAELTKAIDAWWSAK